MTSEDLLNLHSLVIALAVVNAAPDASRLGSVIMT